MELCLISKEAIENPIQLPCRHTFDYIYLYYEIMEQKKTTLRGFHCPYCRAFYDHTLPYYELEGVAKKPNLNYHRSKTMDLMSCLLCSAPAHQFIHGCYCIKHSKIKPMCLGICKHGRPCKNKAGHDLYCKIHLKK